MRPGVERMPIEPMRRWNIEPCDGGLAVDVDASSRRPGSPCPCELADDVDELALG